MLDTSFPTPWKTALITIGVAIQLSSIIAVLICTIYKFSFAPFKAKQTEMLIMASIASNFWYIGSLQGEYIIPQTGAFPDCRVFNLIFQGTFGSSVYFTVLMYRFNTLYTIMVDLDPVTITSRLRVLWLYLPAVLLAIATFIFPNVLLTTYPVFRDNNLAPSCYYTSRIFLGGVYCTYILQAIAIIFLNWKLSKIPAAFNEYVEFQYALIITITSYLIMGILVLANQNSNVWCQIIENIGCIICSNSLIWASISRPVYGFLFQREKYLHHWSNTKSFNLVINVNNDGKDSFKVIGITEGSASINQWTSSIPAAVGLSSSKAE